MKLGETVFLTIYATDLDSSKTFYETLGFKSLDKNQAGIESNFLSDGKLLVSLEQGDEKARAAELTYLTGGLGEQLNRLKKLRIPLKAEDGNATSFADPNGFSVRLVQSDGSEIKKPDGASSAKCGRFYEVSIETENIDSSISFWNALGFDIALREPPTARWATLNDGNINLGLYEKGTCPHRFKNPSLTYFEPDMVERIGLLKSAGVNFVEEMRNGAGEVDNAIAEAPDGQNFFLFFYDGAL